MNNKAPIIYPKKTIKTDPKEVKKFTSQDLEEPLKIACQRYLYMDKTGDFYDMFRSLLGLKAAEIQLKEKNFRYKKIDWKHWIENNMNDIYMIIYLDNPSVAHVQIKTTLLDNQFLLLDVNHYYKNGMFFQSPLYDFSYDGFFLERINIESDLTELIDKLNSSDSSDISSVYEPYLSRLNVQFNAAYSIKTDAMFELANDNIAKKGTVVKADKDHPNPQPLSNDCYYVSICDMHKF